MPLEHAPSTETLLRSLQHQRDREARRLARQRPMREARRTARAGRTPGGRLIAALRRLLPAARRAGETAQ